MTLKDCVVIGGVDMQQQARELAKRPHVVIATPGRLKVRIRRVDSGSWHLPKLDLECHSNVNRLMKTMSDTESPLERSLTHTLKL